MPPRQVPHSAEERRVRDDAFYKECQVFWRFFRRLSRESCVVLAPFDKSYGLTIPAKRSLPHRRPFDQYDRRSVIIHPLRPPEVKQKVAPIFASLGRAMGTVSAGYSSGELAAIASYFTETIEVLKTETAKIKQGSREDEDHH
jgi:hypothetical protein